MRIALLYYPSDRPNIRYDQSRSDKNDAKFASPRSKVRRSAYIRAIQCSHIFLLHVLCRGTLSVGKQRL